MKKTAIIFFTVILFPLFVFTQSIEGVEFISPFNNGVSAIKKENKWAFINLEGTIIVNFRDDLVLTKTNNFNYPVFNNDRCLITKKKDDISYFGYIDKSGNTVIQPQFLNATNFNNNVAIVLELVKESIGYNDILGKEMISYNSSEVIINSKGKVLHYLTEPKHIPLSVKNIKKIVVINSKFISNNLVAIKSKDKKWIIKKIE
jgi:hypothetical protein